MLLLSKASLNPSDKVLLCSTRSTSGPPSEFTHLEPRYKDGKCSLWCHILTESSSSAHPETTRLAISGSDTPEGCETSSGAGVKKADNEPGGSRRCLSGLSA